MNINKIIASLRSALEWVASKFIGFILIMEDLIAMILISQIFAYEIAPILHDAHSIFAPKQSVDNYNIKSPDNLLQLVHLILISSGCLIYYLLRSKVKSYIFTKLGNIWEWLLSQLPTNS